MIKKTRDEWRVLVEEWKASGKTMTTWCREHQIHKNTFIYWVKGGSPSKKIAISSNNHPSIKTKLTRSCFTELSDRQGTGICLEYQGVRIHIDRSFDATTLKSCLSILRGIPC